MPESRMAKSEFAMTQSRILLENDTAFLSHVNALRAHRRVACRPLRRRTEMLCLVCGSRQAIATLFAFSI
jgi:hypothetical protein